MMEFVRLGRMIRMTSPIYEMEHKIPWFETTIPYSPWLFGIQPSSNVDVASPEETDLPGDLGRRPQHW